MKTGMVTERLADRAYDELKQSILSGIWDAGDVLYEVHVAERLEMSRTPVREALRVLAREGFLESAARGFAVPRRSMDDLRELFELRDALEGMASRAAAMRASDEEIAAIARVCDEAAKYEDWESLAPLGTEFHQLIITAARNERLAKMLGSLKGQIILSRHTSMRMLESRRLESVHEHRAIMTAIRDRNPDAAEREARFHVRRSYEVTVQLLTGLSLTSQASD